MAGQASADDASPVRHGGRRVSTEELAKREKVHELWSLFQENYKNFGYTSATKENFLQWVVDNHEDMPTVDLAEVNRLLEAHRKTPSPSEIPSEE